MTEVKFPKPVFHGDTLHVTTEVLSKRETPLASGRGHRRVPAQGLQPARRAGGRMPAPGDDDEAAEGLTTMRSLLFVPADDEKKLGKGADTGADALILDLEDSVSLPRKAAARNLAAQYIAAARSREGGPLLYVRVNALDTDLWQHDVAGVVAARPHGILLPKARSGEDVHKLSIALHHEEERAGRGRRLDAHRRALPPRRRSPCCSFTPTSGRARGSRGSPGAPRTSPPRSARAATARTTAAPGPRPIASRATSRCSPRRPPRCRRSTRCSSISAISDGLRQECRAAVRDGFTGKMAIHPGQVAVINEMFTPSAEEIALSEEIVRPSLPPRCGRPRHPRPHGRPAAPGPRRAHPGARQGGRAVVGSRTRAPSRIATLATYSNSAGRGAGVRSRGTRGSAGTLAACEGPVKNGRSAR